jgi:DNA-binding CsgD family transcriptional regulator
MRQLSPLQLAVLRKLSFGHPCSRIAETLEKSPSNIHMAAYHIRLKTGIDTRNPEQCRKLLGQVTRPIPNVRPNYPTPRQMEQHRLIASGKSYSQIADELRISISTVQNLIAAGARKIGLIRPGYQRTALIRAWLEHPEDRTQKSTHTSPMDDPMF